MIYFAKLILSQNKVNDDFAKIFLRIERVLFGNTCVYGFHTKETHPKFYYILRMRMLFHMHFEHVNAHAIPKFKELHVEHQNDDNFSFFGQTKLVRANKACSKTVIIKETHKSARGRSKHCTESKNLILWADKPRPPKWICELNGSW